MVTALTNMLPSHRFARQRHQFGVKVSFALLDAAHIVVTHDGWPDLRVFQTDPQSDPSVDVLRLKLPPGPGTAFPDFAFRRLQECSIPCPPPDAPFWPDPDLRMIVLVYIDPLRPKRAVLLIPYATFKKLLSNRPLLQSLKTLQPRVEWNEWERDILQLTLSFSPNTESWQSYRYYSFGSRFSLLMSNWAKFPGSATIVTFDLNPWAVKYARNPHSADDMPHLKGCVDSGWKKVFRSTELRRPSSIQYAIHHTFREEHELDGEFTVVSTDPFGYTEVVRTFRVRWFVISDHGISSIGCGGREMLDSCSTLPDMW